MKDECKDIKGTITEGWIIFCATHDLVMYQCEINSLQSRIKELEAKFMESEKLLQESFDETNKEEGEKIEAIDRAKAAEKRVAELEYWDLYDSLTSK